METNYLIIGSGIAGLTLALKLAEKFPERTITVVTKANEDESNTKYAQGGIAVVTDKTKDSYKKHIEDTLTAGDDLCDRDIVEMVVKDGNKRLDELLTWGAHFDKNYNGDFNLGKEGGHSENRILHHKDITGYEIEKTLLKQVHQSPNISILTHHFAVDLISSKNAKNPTCLGAYILNQKTGNIIATKADNTVLATGGIGQVYGHTTNPIIATGDGIAMAFRIDAKISDMEFVQFHPTAFYDENNKTAFLISEAVRGFGAYLRNKNGDRFMLHYDKRAELASRDIVSQSIYKELKNSGNSCVYLDCTHLDIKQFKSHFPNIYSKCLSENIDIEKDWIPVVPVAHYICGGIDVNKYGESSIKNLYACGECSRTGLHGANRLASNSLLEAIVFAHNIFLSLSNKKESNTTIEITNLTNNNTELPSKDIINNYKEKLQSLMRNKVGIIRNNKDLATAAKDINQLSKEVEQLYKKHKTTLPLCELRNMINVAFLIINQSIKRKVNKGGFFNLDNVKEKKVH